MLSEQALERIKLRRGNLHVNFPLSVDKTALLVIDMQNAFCAKGALVETPDARDIVPAINLISSKCRSLSIPVIFIRHVTKAQGADIQSQLSFFANEKREGIIHQLTYDHPESALFDTLEVKDEDLIIEKCRFSALIQGSSILERVLRSMNRDTLIVTGTRTNICCESTVRDAMMLDFKVIVVGDAVAALNKTEHQISLDIMGEVFADVVDTEYLLKALK